MGHVDGTSAGSIEVPAQRDLAAAGPRIPGMSNSNRWWLRVHGLSISIAFITTSGLVALAIGWLMGSGAATAGSSPGWTTYTDATHGFTVQFPSAWRRAETPLVPKLISPGEILSVGTGRLEVGGGGNCGLYPVEALAAMRPSDVLVSIKEWKLGARASWKVQGRPARFRIRSRPASPLSLNVKDQINRWNVDGARNGIRWTDFEFRDRGRVFRVFVAIGKAAPRKIRDSVLSTLDSLRFEREGG